MPATSSANPKPDPVWQPSVGAGLLAPTGLVTDRENVYTRMSPSVPFMCALFVSAPPKVTFTPPQLRCHFLLKPRPENKYLFDQSAYIARFSVVYHPLITKRNEQ
ncbi:hypothetical protein [Pseudomonas izuensis]|uniref:Uncharacterized protein n=1 Tax=Pseudomonas izuensis TaxID=2684212 RepID=A0ABM7RNT3_9PSED|nr:hypothetical protein [Pseudomonas izuensis]BCX66929.1 hypothetical protein LAB08_R15530 [Pseudomonas izuensis]